MCQELRLAQLGGEALVSGEVGVDAADVADLEPVPESIDVSAHLELEVAAPLGEIVHLAALAHPALGLVRCDAAGELAPHQRQRERLRILEPPRHLERLDPEPPSARSHRPSRAVPRGRRAAASAAASLLTDRRERLLEQRDERLVDDARPPPAGRSRAPRGRGPPGARAASAAARSSVARASRAFAARR